MQYFPNSSDYDMSNTGEMALYLAHCDFDPLLGMIEHMDTALSDSFNYYNSMESKANEIGDFHTQCQFSDLIAIFQSKIVPLSYESIILILMSLVEESFKTWCRIIKSTNAGIPDLKDFKCAKHSGLDKSIAYLEQFAQIRGIKSDPLWDYLTVICVIRNAIVHSGGRIEKEENQRKLKRYHFGLFPEDNRVYLEMCTIKEIYNKVIEFVDRVFLIIPS